MSKINSENEKLFDILISNSDINLTEATTTGDVSKAYNDLIGNVIEQSIPMSIASQVCSVQPLTHEGGSVLGLKRTINNTTGEIDIKVKKHAVTQIYDAKFKGTFSIEASQDINAIINSTDFNVFLDASAGTASSKIDSVIVPVLRNLAKPVGSGSILLDPSILEASLQVLYLINLGLAEINVDTKRGMRGYAIVSPTIASIISARLISSEGWQQYKFNPVKVSGDNIGDVYRNNPYYLGSTSNIDFYVDPLAPTDSAIIGYNANLTGESAVIFSPYKFSIYKAIDPDNGDTVFFSILRFGYLRNPLDSGYTNSDSDFLRIIQFDTSNVGSGMGGTNGIVAPHVVYDYMRDEFVASAGQTTFDVTGNGLLANVFVDGVLLRITEYSFNNPTVVFNEGLAAGSNVVVESFTVA